jgi:hypothetical protein
MAAFNFRRRQTRRWWYSGATLVLVVFFAVFYVAGAGATIGSSNFEGGDANMVVNNPLNTDWCTDYPAPASPVTCATPIAGLNTGTDLASGTSDNSFGQGTKEDSANVTVVSGSIPPNKSDLTRFYEASQLGSDNHVYLQLAWERTNNLGNANMDFEIDQSSNGCPNTPGPCTISRSNGDILVTYDFPGSGAPALGILRWLTVGGVNPYAGTPGGPPAGTLNANADCFSANKLPCWGDQQQLKGTNSEGGVDTGPDGMYDPISGQQVVQDGFGEAQIDLTATNVITSQNGCEFQSASTFLKSRSSSSFTSEIKDFVAPVSTPVISNCGGIKIIKRTDPRGQDQAFSFGSTLPAGTQANVGGVNGVDANGNFSLNDSAGTDNTTNTVTETNIQQGDYTVTEGAEPSGFTAKPLNCSTSGSGGSTTDISGQAATIHLKPNDTVTCIYTNQLNTAKLSTNIDAGPVSAGTAVHDTATIVGNQAITPAGTVTFSMCGPTQTQTGCSAGGDPAGSGTPSGSGGTASLNSSDVNTSDHPLHPGWYCFRAVWTGDTNYPASVPQTEYGGSGGTNECFQVSKIPTTVATAPSVGSGATVNFGSSVSDNATIAATLSGGGAIAGTITFSVCNPMQTTAGACPSGGTTVSSTSTLTGGNTTPPSATASSSAITANMTGTWCFRAVFTPSGNDYTGNGGSTASDSSSDECFTVTDTTSASSTQSWVPNDTASVTSAHGAPLTGTLTVQLYTGTGCQNGNAVSGKVYTQSANGTSSTVSLTTSNTTSYTSSMSWLVSFSSSDPNVSSPTAHCESSTLSVTN